MKLSVKNIGPVRAAEIEIDRLTLLVGKNEAGKSTLCSALAALLKTGSAAFASTKKGLVAAVTDGEAHGMCLLSNGADWAARLVLPDGERTEQNAPQAPKVSDTALGLPFTALKPKDRATVLQKVLGVKVSGKDIAVALAKDPINYDERMAISVMDNMKEIGWDSLERRYREDSTKKKGAWEAATSTRYGSDKAGSWHPEGLTETIQEARLEDLTLRVDTAGKKVDALRAANAVSGADHEALEAASAKLPAALEAEAAAHTAHEQADKAVDEKRAELSTVPDPNASAGIPCPHCGKPLKLDTSERHAIKVLALPVTTDLNTRELQDARMRRAAILGEIERLQALKTASWQTFVDAAAAVKTAKRAKEQLEMGGDAEATEEIKTELAVAEAEATIAQVALQLRQTHDKAQAFHREAVVALAIADLLAPSGLRQKAMDARIADFNSELARLAQGAGMDDPVEITPDLEVRRGTRPYERLSRGAKFAVDIVLQLGLAKRAGDAILLIDDFEMLVGQHRSGILKILAASQLPVLVAVAAKEIGNLQNMVNANLGRVYQVEGGSTREIERSAA